MQTNQFIGFIKNNMNNVPPLDSVLSAFSVFCSEAESSLLVSSEPPNIPENVEPKERCKALL